MSGQTLMKRTKYFFFYFVLMLSEANSLCARENGAFVEVFSSLKHIKNLYLSSFLTQKSNFPSLPNFFFNIFIEPIIIDWRMERGKVDLVNDWNSLDIDVSELN